eukprot:gnl/MRDRNA2_/MRDRNA2_86226_c0_seq1.p1 gnl/MRDRNA2_/MRDRNA2_86226_c0~~gnl/MRDRNA2_/MRDRNA2_86226_c0_seq1.p1  ORF type:complete len:385 (+),score=73.56 gnl/MRDRNA2_/MRDRNA2_86226_c0_seq1:69-1223(+)
MRFCSRRQSAQAMAQAMGYLPAPNAIHGFQMGDLQERETFNFPRQKYKKKKNQDGKFDSSHSSDGIVSSMHCGPLNPRSFLDPRDSEVASQDHSLNPDLQQGLKDIESNVKHTAQTILSAAGLTVEDKIGKGTFSHVYKAISPNGLVAVKVMLYKSKKPMILDEAEVAVLQSLRHQHIVQFIDVCHGATTCMVFEFCAGGDLYTLLHKTGVPHELSLKQHLSMVRGIADAIQYLHSQGIIHRDVKSPNCLLAEALTNANEIPAVKLADFGFAKVMNAARKRVGPFRWMAPEVLAGDPYDNSSDVYSFGVFMYEVFSHTLPYGKQALDPRFGLQIYMGRRPDINMLPGWCPEDLRALIESCWKAKPSERPKLDTVVEVIDKAMWL